MRHSMFLGAAILAAACGSGTRDVASQPPSTPRPAQADAGSDPPVVDAGPPPASGTFPASFLFGTAIAGFQVDMGCPTVAAAACEDRASDWYQWITTQRILDNPLQFMAKDPPSSGPGFYELYENDFDRAAGQGETELGSKAVRLSIEWSRIFPQATFDTNTHSSLKAIASAEGIDYYHRLFAAMRQRGLSPFVTLNHYSLPLWVHDGDACNQSLDMCIAQQKGGWADPDRGRIVNEIAKYAAFVAEEYGGEVDRWATLNEPFSAVVVAGYLVQSPQRSNPPGLSLGVAAAKTAALAMIEAHARMYDAVHMADNVDADGDGTAAEVGIVYAYSAIEPLTSSADDAKAAADAKYFFEDMFMDGVVLGRVDENWDVGPGVAPVRSDIAGRVDFIGVNYYFRFQAQAFTSPLSIVSPFLTFNMLREFDGNYPQGIHDVLVGVANKYGKPIYVSETGTTQDDEARGAAWVVRTLSETRRAIRDGSDVRGYFAWSLMDNYEWNHGMGMRFGLYAVDATTKDRALRDSGAAFAAIAKARDVPASLEAEYASHFK